MKTQNVNCSRHQYAKGYVVHEPTTLMDIHIWRVGVDLFPLQQAILCFPGFVQTTIPGWNNKFSYMNATCFIAS